MKSKVSCIVKVDRTNVDIIKKLFNKTGWKVDYKLLDNIKEPRSILCNSMTKKVVRYCGDIDDPDLKEGIEEIKRKCKDKSKLESLIKEYTDSQRESKPIGYLYGEGMKGYLTDVFFCQAYAEWNHKCIGDAISDIMRKKGYGKVIDTISTIHNYISPRDHIIRKGSIAAYEGERLIIPFNMRDGLAICEGKSNPDWNYSAPHGAGRIMSRSKAKENVDLEEFKETMKGIYSTSICSGTLDESPMVYKPMEEIIRNIEPTAKILYFIKPCINIKATDDVE